jgi:hypothetical protein
MLVEKEMRCDKKIGMLNRMGEVERALEEAEASGDSDLSTSLARVI